MTFSIKGHYSQNIPKMSYELRNSTLSVAPPADYMPTLPDTCIETTIYHLPPEEVKDDGIAWEIPVNKTPDKFDPGTQISRPWYALRCFGFLFDKLNLYSCIYGELLCSSKCCYLCRRCNHSYGK
jgi:hypothetical protein